MKEVKARLGELPAIGASLKSITVNHGVKITSHEELEGRDQPNQHPAEAITGLRELMENLLGEAKASGEFDGKDGKSAYETALSGGFSGSEEEFAEKLAKGAPGAFYVTISEDGTSIDKTDEEIAAAFESGASIYAIFPFDGLHVLMPLLTCLTPDIAGTYIWVFSLNANDFSSGSALCASVLISSGQVLSVSGNELATIDSIPEIPYQLPNPCGLSFTGAVNTYYDGSSYQTVAIPKIPNALKNPEKLTVDGIEYDGSSAVTLYTGSGKSVKAYGAMGDGATDDTVAFKNALAENRIVYVPEGTYIISDTLTVGSNCCLELSQATVLKFTQTNKNCISMLRLASIKGNHATIFVPYTFTATAICCDTEDDTAVLDPNNLATSNAEAVPPFKKWDPQWKMSRYITDINICKVNDTGSASTSNFHYSEDGKCYGTALYIHCNAEDYVSYMWGVNMSGIRIAGGFNYGIRIHNIGETSVSWNHDMRIEAVIDACKIGVSVDNCRYARLAVTVQPRLARNNTAYAEHGIELINSRGIDLSSSRVWDWMKPIPNTDPVEYITLFEPGNKYQHIALVGECMGLILDDYLYYAQSTFDIRDIIYTDTPSNLEKMTLLQEPFTRWFKPIDGIPYFFNGIKNRQLLTDDALDPYFKTDTVKSFTDSLASATDTDGVTVFNEIGYKNGVRFTSLGTGTTLTPSEYYMTTGFIKLNIGDVIYTNDLSFNADIEQMSWAGMVYYDADHNHVGSMTIARIVLGDAPDWVINYAETSNGCTFKIPNSQTLLQRGVTYVRLVFPSSCVGENPMISVNDPIRYAVEGFLADGVKVKGEHVIVSSDSGKAFKLTVSENGTLSTVPIE